MDLIVRQARIAGYSELQDVGVAGGVIREITPRIPAVAKHEFEAGGKLVLSGFVDTHVHLDKAMTVTPNSFVPGTILDRVKHLSHLKKTFEIENVCSRATAMARVFARRGVLNLRTSVDVDPTVGLRALKGILEARNRCKDFINIQVFAFAQEGIIRYPEVQDLLREALRLGADGVAGHTSIEPEGKRHVDTILGLAKEFDVDVEFHVDENADPNNSLMEYVISEALSEGYSRRLNAVHCAALGTVDPKIAQTLSKKAAEAAISVTVCPGIVVLDCPLPPTMTLLNSGVNVSLGSDNIRDPINPLGAGDPLVLCAMLSHWQKLFTENELASLFEMVTTNGAKTLGIASEYGVNIGNQGNFVILDCHTPSEAMLEIPQRIEVFKGGKRIRDLIQS